MAPIKFEENIREKLEQRSLQPSANAWQSLEQKLNADTKKRKTSKFWWFGIAASFIGLFYVVQEFISFDNTNHIITPTVVDTGNDTINTLLESPLRIEETQQIAQEQKDETLLKNKLNAVSAQKISSVNTNQAPLKVSGIKKNQDAPKSLNEEIILDDDVVSKIKNVTASSQNNTIQISASETSSSEIDALLNAANKDIQLNSNTVINSISIDANALLEDVETKMPPSIKGQLFKVIEKNFKTAKTAIATRNE